MPQNVSGAASPLGTSRAELREERRYAALFDAHKRHLAYALLAVLLALAGYWFYLRSRALKTAHAETAYEQAMQSAASGNIPLAESDLRKAAVRYAGTDGGAEAALSLAKLEYQQRKWQAGIAALQQTAGHGGDMQFDARMLIGAGYEGLNQPARAAQTYEEAARVARFPSDAAGARAMAARAYETAGNRAAAIRLWTELAHDANGGYAGEAAVRLGELQATAIRS